MAANAPAGLRHSAQPDCWWIAVDYSRIERRQPPQAQPFTALLPFARDSMAAPASMEAVRAAFSEFAHDGVLPRADVGNALRRLGIAPTRSDLVVVLQELDPACAGRVGFDSFVKCYSHLAGGYKGSRFNRLLVKDVVGRARRSNYDLPPDTHVYGKVVTRDPESAGEVVLHWKAGTLSKPREQARNLVEMNKHAAAAGCIGAKAVRDFREGHDIRFKSKESFVKPQERPVSVPDIVFGQKNRCEAGCVGLSASAAMLMMMPPRCAQALHPHRAGDARRVC